MPKVTVTIAYDSMEEAFADLMPQQPAINIQLAELGEFKRPDVQPEVQPARGALVEDLLATKKPRKPRADAGVPRGPYKKGEEPKEPAAPATQASAPESSPAPAAAEPVKEQPAKELTIDDLKAAMTVLAKKKNIEANMAVLRRFSVEKVSALPKDKYPAFLAAVKAEAGV